jgi:subtilase family serine protease
VTTRRNKVLNSMRRRVAVAALAVGAAFAITTVAPVSATTTADVPVPAATTATPAVDACANPPAGQVRCLAEVSRGARHKSAALATPNGTTGLPAGYGPADLESAYGLTSAIKAGRGTGETVAIVDGYDDPTAEADLATYRSTYGLSACTTADGCFRKVGEQGQAAPLPAADGDWSVEISLDLDAVSSACPDCHILLVEGDVPAVADLANAENTAVAMGANAVSNSYSIPENSAYGRFASAYDHPGVAITVASGDTGYQLDAPFPADLPTVTAVGGTTLSPARNRRGWTETDWSTNAKDDAAGAACSAWYGKPSWQHDTACPGRTIADVSADADPHTGFAVYDTTPNPLGIPSGWMVIGGTSAATPFIAGVYALAGNTNQITGASYAYAHRQFLNDVVGGTSAQTDTDQDCPTTSYVCSGVAGYDGPTGLGTPNGTGAF